MVKKEMKDLNGIQITNNNKIQFIVRILTPLKHFVLEVLSFEK